MGIKTGIFKSVREIKHDYALKIVLVELTTISDSNILICSCYRPSKADRIWIENFKNFLNDVCPRVFAGDFNLPRVIWNSRKTSVGVNETKFIEIIDNVLLEQINNIPTRENNVLDLLITSIPDKIKIGKILKPTDVHGNHALSRLI